MESKLSNSWKISLMGGSRKLNFISICLLSLLGILIVSLIYARYMPILPPDKENFVKITEVADLETVIDFNSSLLFIGQAIRFYNSDGSLWYESVSNESGGKMWKENLSPFAYHPGYSLFKFRVTGKSSNWIEIIADENTGVKKYIRAQNLGIKFKGLEEYILQQDTVNTLNNKLYSEPNGEEIRDFPYRFVRKIPVQIEDNWLKFKFKIRESEYKEAINYDNEIASIDETFGWIKWKNGEKISVDFFYFK